MNKDEPCRYCLGLESIQTSKHPGTIIIDGGRIKIMLCIAESIDEGKKRHHIETTTITDEARVLFSFCPMCGRELN